MRPPPLHPHTTRLLCASSASTSLATAPHPSGVLNSAWCRHVSPTVRASACTCATTLAGTAAPAPAHAHKQHKHTLSVCVRAKGPPQDALLVWKQTGERAGANKKGEARTVQGAVLQAVVAGVKAAAPPLATSTTSSSSTSAAAVAAHRRERGADQGVVVAL